MQYRLSGKMDIRDNFKMYVRHNMKLGLVMLAVMFVGLVVSMLIRNYVYAGLILLYIAFVFVFFYFQARRIYNSNPSLQGVQTYSVRDDGIFYHSDMGNSTITKKAIVRIAYFQDALYIYVSRQSAFIVKADWLENGTWKDFSNFMRENYPNPARKNKFTK